MPRTAAEPAVDLVFRAFADRTRLRILHLLDQREELCVCDLIRVLELPQPTVSRHLAYLRRAGLVAARKDGQWVHYRLLAPRGAFHKKIVECLRCCLGSVPELRDDRKRLGRGAASGCC